MPLMPQHLQGGWPTNDALRCRQVRRATADAEAPKLHRTRELLIRQKTMFIKCPVRPARRVGLDRACAAGWRCREPATKPCVGSHRPTQGSDAPADGVREQIVQWHRSSKASLRLQSVPGVGPITASVVVLSVNRLGLTETVEPPQLLRVVILRPADLAVKTF
jgi:transposase